MMIYFMGLKIVGHKIKHVVLQFLFKNVLKISKSFPAKTSRGENCCFFVSFVSL